MAKLSQSARKRIAKNIFPIVEFFPVDPNPKYDSDFIDTKLSDRSSLRTVLSKSKGIYAFYNSEAEIIYVGKSKSNLWTEMKSAYVRPMAHYSRFYVNHPHDKYELNKSGKVHPIKNKTFSICHVAYFFSAYHVEDDDLLDIIELMLIRVVPNDLINIKMEGKDSLRVRKLD